MGEHIIVNERGAYGGTVEGPFRTTFVVTASEAISIGHVVELDADDYDSTTSTWRVQKATGLLHNLVGVALEAAAAAGDRIRVCKFGICDVMADAAITKDAQLVVSGGAGLVDDDAVSAGNKVIGTALEAASAQNDLIAAFVNI